MWGWLAKLVAPVVQAFQTIVKAVTAAFGGTGNGGQAGGGAGNPGSQSAPAPIEQSEAEDIAQIRERQRRAAEQKRQAAIKKKIAKFDEQYDELSLHKAGRKRSEHLAPTKKHELVAGNILTQDIVLASRHEGRPRNVSNKDYLNRFARSGWDEEETVKAYTLLALPNDGRASYKKIDNTVSFEGTQIDFTSLFAEARLNVAPEDIARLTTITELKALEEDSGNLRYQVGILDSAQKARDKQNKGEPLTEAEQEDLKKAENIDAKSISEQWAAYQNTRSELLQKLGSGEQIQATLGLYEQALKGAYGITIEGIPWQGNYEASGQLDVAQITTAFETITNYNIGADQMATWLLNTYSTNLGDIDKYDAFRLVMGNIVIQRYAGKEPPPGATSPSIGFTTDHVIYDRFDPKSEKRAERWKRPAPMTPNNFAHELAHAFVNSSGFGSWLGSPVYGGQRGAPSSLTQEMEDIINKYIVLQNQRPEGAVEPGSPNEDIANFIESLVNGRLTPQELNAAGFDTKAFSLLLDQALVANVLRNTSPTMVAALLGTQGITANAMPGISIFASSTTGSQQLGITSNQVTILAKSVGQNGTYYVYIAVDRGGYYDYGWVDKNAVDITATQFDALPEKVIEGATSYDVQDGTLVYSNP